MIEGVVNADYEAIIPLRIQGPDGRTRDIEAVVDTGFTDFLTLPPALVDELGLPQALNLRSRISNSRLGTGHLGSSLISSRAETA